MRAVRSFTVATIICVTGSACTSGALHAPSRADAGAMADGGFEDMGPTDAPREGDSTLAVDGGVEDSGSVGVTSPEPPPPDGGVEPANTGDGGTRDAANSDASPPDAACSNDVGVAQCPTWRRIGISGEPGPRFGVSAVYDPGSDRVLFYGGAGGGTHGNVWILEGASSNPRWLEGMSGTADRARSQHTAVFDSDTSRMVVFGGADPQGTRLADTHVLSNTGLAPGAQVWMTAAPTGGPPEPRQNHLVGYDDRNDVMMVFGGVGGMTLDTYWALTGAAGATPAWQPLATQGARRLTQATGAYDPASNRMLLFGGSDSDASAAFLVLTNANGMGGMRQWLELMPVGPNRPAARNGAMSGYDSARNRFVLFGGRAGDGTLLQEGNTVWILENANGLDCDGTPTAPRWRPVSACGAATDIPRGRDLAAAVYLPGPRRLIMFGGRPENAELYFLDNAIGL